VSTALELVLVRHGESEANIVQRRDHGPDKHPKQAEVYARLDALQRLSARGRVQAQQAGAWLRVNGLDPAGFDERFVSPFNRAMETAVILGGDDVSWLPEVRLIERDWGEYGATPAELRAKLFPHTEQVRAQNSMFARLDGGESITDVVYRLRDFLGTVARENAEQRVLAVTHAEVLWTARLVIERLLPTEWRDLVRRPDMRMGNCCILQFSRVNPEDPGDIRPSLSLGWRRIVNLPGAPFGSPYGGQWVHLEGKRHYSGAQLMALVESTAERLITDDDTPGTPGTSAVSATAPTTTAAARPHVGAG
jgi:broad specificity phosphatase PhoE